MAPSLPLTRFRRAVAFGNLAEAKAAAHDVGALDDEAALQLVLLY